MTLITATLVTALALFALAAIIYVVFTRKERREIKYARPKSYVREIESEYLNNL